MVAASVSGPELRLLPDGEGNGDRFLLLDEPLLERDSRRKSMRDIGVCVRGRR